MNSDDDDLSSFRDGHWRVQPNWVKTLTISVGIPASLVLMTGVFTGNIGGPLDTAAFIAFVAVAALQMAFVLRAYWRMDL
jgi:hypothetical protein